MDSFIHLVGDSWIFYLPLPDMGKAWLFDVVYQLWVLGFPPGTHP
ncbi:hypothetical protein [Rhodococcus oryzae]